MRIRNHIWFFLPVVLLTACSLIYDQSGSADCPELNIAIEFPSGTPSLSKADVGEVPASIEENAIKDLSIWVFNHQSQELVTEPLIIDTDSDHLPHAGGVRKYALPVTREFLNARPNVDVFVLVNKSSINPSLGEESWEDLKKAVFGGEDYFAPCPDNKIKKTVPSNGLPMSGVGYDLKVVGEEPSLSIPTVSVGRAVSKLRYIFSKMESAEEEYVIKSVVLDGGQIPVQEYVFSSEPYNIVKSYVSESMVTNLESVELANCSTPELYAYAGQDGPSYESLISEGIALNHLTDCGTFYLRESDKALTGTINYSITKKDPDTGDVIDVKEASKTFTMANPGDFARNHTWTVYGYFIGGRSLQLAIHAMPWDKSDYDISFSTASLMVTHKLAVNDKSVESIDRDAESGEYNVTLKRNSPASAYLNVVTPMGGKLQLIVFGDQDAFDVWFTDENNRNARETTIDPDFKSGLINISIDRKESYSGVTTGKSITLNFLATTPDGEREIGGESECIDQVFNFILP